MKKTLAVGFAAVLAATATMASSGATAKPMYWKHPPMMYHQPQGFFFSTPFFFGFQMGPRYPQFRVSRHVQWCSWKYRTYNAATNTFHPKKGVTAVCISPFHF